MSRVLDVVAKSLAGATSRREVLKSLAGVLFLGTTGCGLIRRILSRPAGESASVCYSAVCSNGCCSSTSDTSTACTNCLAQCEACPSMDQLCYQGCAVMTCCPGGSICCGGNCVNTNYNVNNCGGCTSSTSTSVLQNGTTSNSPTGTGTDCTTLKYTAPICCSGTCQDASVSGNCGGCGRTCTGSTTCKLRTSSYCSSHPSAPGCYHCST